jgi:hypothetical protein
MKLPKQALSYDCVKVITAVRVMTYYKKRTPHFHHFDSTGDYPFSPTLAKRPSSKLVEIIMQVTHTEDHVTHAVIGGAKQIDYYQRTVLNSFYILSSTLYSDQKLAVVRETVCNAWDAHIDSNRKDKAITITVFEEAITIRDYVYGHSQGSDWPYLRRLWCFHQKNDGNATGGFWSGLQVPICLH